MFTKSVEAVLVFAALGLILSPVAASGSSAASTVVEGVSYLDGTPVTVAIEGERIVGVSHGPLAPSTGPERLYVAPGLIDNQVNGYVSVNFTAMDLSVDGMRKAVHGLWKDGVTTVLPTVTTNRHEILLHSFEALAAAAADPEIGSSIAGFHLEGPYISPIDGYRGAHPLQWVRPPDWEQFQQYQKAAKGKIIQVSLAPEIDGAIEFIRKLSLSGVTVALAHHNGSVDDVRNAVDLGARISTHLGNGCANTINRFRNPLWPQLAEDRLMASLIVDGFHLRPEQVRTFFRAKGPDRIVLTSDVTHFAGMPAGEYDADGEKVVLSPEGKLTLPSQDVLYGAAVPLRAGIGNLMRFTDCSMAEAVHAATRNPARLYGLSDRGELLPGKRADLILFRMNNGRVEIVKTYVGGKVVFP